MKKAYITILFSLLFFAAFAQTKVDINSSEFQKIMSLYNEAEDYKSNQQYALAITTYQKVISNFKATYGDAHEYYGIFLNNLALIHHTISQYEKALPLYQEALLNTKNTLGTNHSEYGTRLNNIALLHKNMGHYDQALPLYIEALKNAKTSLGIEHPNYGSRLYNLGDFYESIGQYKSALPLYIEALENAKNTIGKKHSHYSKRLNNLANVYNKMGLYNKALPLYFEALENTKNTLGKKHSDYGKYLNNLGSLYMSMGHYGKALPLYTEAIENTISTLGKNNSDYNSRLNNLAHLYQEIGDNKKALNLYLECLESAKNTVGENHQFYGTYLNNLGSLYLNMRQYKKALPLYLEALENTKSTLGENHPDYGSRLNNLALLYKNLGDNKKALSLSLEALESTKNTLSKTHSEYGIRLNNLVLLYENLNQFDKALPLTKELNTNTFNLIRKNFSYQTADEKQKFINNKIGHKLNNFSHFNYVSNYSFKKTIARGLNNILISKGLLLNANKNILNELNTLNNETINNKVSEFIIKKEIISTQLQLPIANRNENFNKKEKEFEALERSIINLYNQHFEAVNFIKDYKQTLLKAGDLAIEFTHFDVINTTFTDSTMYVAYLYKKDWLYPKAINLFEEKQLKKLLNTSSNPNKLYTTRGSKAKSNASQLALADSIYKLVWKPIEKHTNTSSKIYYSPDGLLHKIPFAALPNSENKLLGEVYQLNQMGNTADIRKHNKQPNLNDAILIGGVDYTYIPNGDQKVIEDNQFSILESEQLLGNEDYKKRSSESGSWSYLKGTKKEVNRIKDILPTSKVLSNKEATETAFKNLSGNSPSVLHIATHGYFFPDLKEMKDEQVIGMEKPYVHAENPLLRSGLIFANANYAWQNGNNPYEEDDGILTALEISNLDLKNTDIVILSACETGLGDIDSSEGVYGLQRAFKMAGVKTIIMSLWEVPDAETAEFMDLFYTKWKAINDPKQAFKHTQRLMMKTYRNNPEKWAAFVLFE